MNIITFTARHLFCETSSLESVFGHHFSEDVRRRIKRVATESHGFLGAHLICRKEGTPAKHVGVDIAVITIQQEFKPNCQNTPIPTLFEGKPNDLFRKKVEKLGSTTDHTVGVVVPCNYRPNFASFVGSDCVFVQADPEGKMDHFSMYGAVVHSLFTDWVKVKWRRLESSQSVFSDGLIRGEKHFTICRLLFC